MGPVILVHFNPKAYTITRRDTGKKEIVLHKEADYLLSCHSQKRRRLKDYLSKAGT